MVNDENNPVSWSHETPCKPHYCTIHPNQMLGNLCFLRGPNLVDHSPRTHTILPLKAHKHDHSNFERNSDFSATCKIPLVAASQAVVVRSKHILCPCEFTCRAIGARHRLVEPLNQPADSWDRIWIHRPGTTCRFSWKQDGSDGLPAATKPGGAKPTVTII